MVLETVQAPTLRVHWMECLNPSTIPNSRHGPRESGN